MVIRLGTLYDLSNPDNPIKLEGYHVDSIVKIKGADKYLITPSSPMHKFAGAETFHYKFNSIDDANKFLTDEVIAND